MTGKNSWFSQLFLRLAISVTMLSAVADRLGFWGENSAWGNWENFEKYTRKLTFFLPENLSVFSAYMATFLEIIFPLMLIFGFRTKTGAYGAGFLLLTFALSMTLVLGIKMPLDYSVRIACAAAFLLARQEKYSFTLAITTDDRK